MPVAEAKAPGFAKVVLVYAVARLPGGGATCGAEDGDFRAETFEF
jgi:hypothetical protein